VLYVLPGAVIWVGLLRAGVHPTFAGVLLGLLTPVRRGSASPVERLEARLHPWVAFGVLPVFALANGGVDLREVHLRAPGALGVFGGVAAGLVVGKPVGVLLASYLSVRLTIAALPRGIQWRGIAVVGAVAGIGFTMAIFIADLAFPDEAMRGTAKAAVLAASVTAAVLALVFGKVALPQVPASVTAKRG
jgi:NhaA family Na+:H+ antiporter